MNRARDDGEAGYALVAAVASIAVFAMIALAIMSATRGAIITGTAEVEQARAAAAADAGVAIGIARLLSLDPAQRPPVDGRVRSAKFEGARLAIAVEDERGKVPLNLVDQEIADRLFAAVGLKGDRATIARDSLLDWIDADDDTRASGAESGYYARFGYRAKNGALGSLGELRRIRGFDAVLVDRIAEIATVDFGRANFEPRYAKPLALEVMRGDVGTAAAIEREREFAGQTTAIELTQPLDLTGRPLTIVVGADTPGGGHADRRVVVELTGSTIRPYAVRSYE